MEEPLIPYTDHLWVEIVKKEQVLMGDNETLCTYGQVKAIGPDVTDTKVDDYVAFEEWDVKSFMLHDKAQRLIKESEVISKIPLSRVMVA